MQLPIAYVLIVQLELLARLAVYPSALIVWLEPLAPFLVRVPVLIVYLGPSPDPMRRLALSAQLVLSQVSLARQPAFNVRPDPFQTWLA